MIPGGGLWCQTGDVLVDNVDFFVWFFWKPLLHGDPNKETNIVCDYILLIRVVKIRAGHLQLPARYLKIGAVMAMKLAEEP